jgi:hypothetical protein
MSTIIPSPSYHPEFQFNIRESVRQRLRPKSITMTENIEILISCREKDAGERIVGSDSVDGVSVETDEDKYNGYKSRDAVSNNKVSGTVLISGV